MNWQVTRKSMDYLNDVSKDRSISDKHKDQDGDVAIE